MTQNDRRLTFKIYRGDTFLAEQSFDQAVIKIGTLVSSHLQLQDPSVSRMHAVVEILPEKVSLIDLGSTAGTCVNGTSINRTTLHSGDIISIGELSAHVHFPNAEQESSSSVPVAAMPPAMPPAMPTVAAPALPPAMPPAMPAVAAPALPPAAAPPLFVGSPASHAPQSIEVTAMLGDSVVGVKHVMNPKAGKPTRLTYAALAIGALLLLSSAVAFSSGFSNAADNKARYHQHIEAKKVATDFRPRRLAQSFDFLAIGGLIGGLLCVTFGMLRIREERIAPTFRIGNAPGVDLPCQEAPLADFSLIAPDGEDFALHFDPSWQGELRSAAGLVSLADLVEQRQVRASEAAPGAMKLSILPDTEINLQTGKQSFRIRSVAKPRKQATPLLASFDSQLLSYLAGSAIMVGGFVLMIGTLHADSKTLYGDTFADSGRDALVRTSAFEDPLKEELTGQDEDAGDGGGSGTKMSEVEGKMGDKTSDRADGQFAIKFNNAAPTMASRSEAREHASHSGVLGYLATTNAAFMAVNASGNISSGLDNRDVYGGLTGSEVAAASGGWGYGIEGIGPGGGCIGCENWGTAGTGNYKLIGHSTGTGDGYRPGHGGKNGMRRHTPKVPKLKIGPVSKSGGIDAEIIRRHIRRKLTRIRHCYEKQLLVHSDLQGTVTTRFQISPTGAVQGISASGMGDKEVENCVAETIQSIQFPKPLDGGYVNVKRYPFIFRPAGG